LHYARYAFAGLKLIKKTLALLLEDLAPGADISITALF